MESSNRFIFMESPGRWLQSIFCIPLLSTIKSWIYVVLPRELFDMLKSVPGNSSIYFITPKFTLDCNQVSLVTSNITKRKLIFEIMREVGLKVICLTWQIIWIYPYKSSSICSKTNHPKAMLSLSRLSIGRLLWENIELQTERYENPFQAYYLYSRRRIIIWRSFSEEI